MLDVILSPLTVLRDTIQKREKTDEVALVKAELHFTDGSCSTSNIVIKAEVSEFEKEMPVFRVVYYNGYTPKFR